MNNLPVETGYNVTYKPSPEQVTLLEKIDIKPYVDPVGRHRHRCADCQFIWEHADTCWNSDKDHICPGCGVELYENGFRYRGDSPPDKKPRKKVKP